jgi:hypothetical protein
MDWRETKKIEYAVINDVIPVCSGTEINEDYISH